MLSGIAAGLAVAMPLGAIGVLIVELGARAGFRAGASAGLGTALCDDAAFPGERFVRSAMQRVKDDHERMIELRELEMRLFGR